jgi:hypothetical protein
MQVLYGEGLASHTGPEFGTDAFAGALTRGSIGTIPETAETKNTKRQREDSWLSNQNSNQD